MKSDYKYPYIPKAYYPAVMYACSLIRKYGTFNVAVNTAANKYDVDPDIVAEHVRKRQGAGQKGSTRKYYYYAVIGYTDCWYQDYDFDIPWSQYEPDEWRKTRKIVTKVMRATSLENVKNRIPKGGLDREGRSYGQFVTGEEIRQFSSEKEAEDWLCAEFEEWKRNDRD